MSDSLPHSVSQISFATLIGNPCLAEYRVIAIDGEEFHLRPLNKEDSSRFADFLDGLLDETRSKYGPHPLNRNEAEGICSNLNDAEMLRLVLFNVRREIVGYTILSLRLRDSQVERFAGYGLNLISGCDACLAPVMADEYQNRGIGTAMLSKTLELARSLGLRRITLWQGTQVANTRAIHCYEKLGFRPIADFEKYGTLNRDMLLTL